MSKPKVMFIDDEERIVRSLALQFAKNYTIKTCVDPAEALNLIKHEHFHVVVSDQRMPKMTGVELLRQVRELSPQSIGILLTGYSDLHAITGAINESEIFRYITKPWDRNELSRVMDSATEIALQMETHAATATANSASSHQILIIDDSQAVYEAIANQFKNRYMVHWASNMDQAYALLIKHNIAIIITDLRLGGEDITPALNTLKQHNSNVMAIVLTATQDSGLLVSLINQTQIFRYLPKPIRHTLLDKSVEAAFKHHERLACNPELAKRYKVDKSDQEPVVSNNIMNFLNRIREHFTTVALHKA